MTERHAAAFTMSAVAPLRTQREFAAALPRRPAPAELSVVSFVQRGCRACRYSSAQFRRLAEDRTLAAAAERAADGVRFYEMDIDAARALCADLGVSAVPSFHFYAYRPGEDPGVGILDTVVGPRAVKDVRERVDQFSHADFDIDDYAFG